MVATANAASLRARRRIGFLGMCAIGLVGLLVFRLWALTVWHGEELREEAESRLDRSIWLPTIRGSIIDRKGRVLAMDVPAWDVAIDYAVVNGSWVREHAERDARHSFGRSLWSKLPKSARDAAIESRIPPWQGVLDGVLNQVSTLCEVPRSQLDGTMREVFSRVERRAEGLWLRQREASARQGEQADVGVKPTPIREQRMSHVLVQHVPDAVAFALRKLGDAYPGTVEVLDGTRRVQLWSSADVQMDASTLPAPLRRGGLKTVRVAGVLDHVLGSVRGDVWAEDLARRPFTRPDGSVDAGGYGPTPDSIGSRGLEAAYEDWLRGERGQLRTKLDTNQTEREDPKPGRDLKLTIDAGLQARVQAILNPRLGLTKVQPWQHGGKPPPLPDGTALASAAVVLEIETGDILALGSWPTLADSDDLSASDRRRLVPGLDRAAEAVYPPGSIVKPLVYAGAVAKNRFPTKGAVVCQGHFFPELKDKARCWIWRPEHGMSTHSGLSGGPLSIEEAISRSCNIYFYTVAQKFGLRGMVQWYRDLGVGQTLGTGLQGSKIAAKRGDAGEGTGILPSDEDMTRLEARRDAFTPIILGIGQGPIAWTPLQAANAFATLARGGVLRDARIVSDDAALPPDRRTGSLNIPDEARKRAIEGLRQAVEANHGTGHHVKYGDGSTEVIFDVPGVRVQGKTGTAQASPLVVDGDGDGSPRRILKGLDHSWFVGLVGDRAEKEPMFAIAVLVEYGGSGGKTAGPIAEQVVRALLDEGYLDGEKSGGKPRTPSKKSRALYNANDMDVGPPEAEDPEG